MKKIECEDEKYAKITGIGGIRKKLHVVDKWRNSGNSGLIIRIPGIIRILEILEE